METNNENRRENGNSDAGRDGNSFRRNNFDSSKGTRGGNRFDSRNEGYQRRDGNRSYDGNRSNEGYQRREGYRSNDGNRSNEGYQRREGFRSNEGNRSNEGYQRREGSRSNDGNRSNEGYQRREGFRSNEGNRSNEGYQRREGFRSNEGNRSNEGYQRREGFRSNDGNRSNEGYQRREGQSFRPGNDQGSRFGGERRSFDKPRFDNRDNRGERSDSRPGGFRNRFDSNEGTNAGKLNFRKSNETGDSKYIETRFDNQREGVVFRKRKGTYDPNAKYSKKKQIEYRNNFIDPTKPIRLNRFLANAGVCSRREADEFIQAGVISVNGVIVSELGTKVLPVDNVMFHNQPVKIEKKVYILLNKPKDCVTTSEDTHARMTVMDLVKNACSERVYPVGRLDRNTTGVLLLTNDGDLASKLTHPKNDKKKIYHVGLASDLTAEDYEKIINGVDLGDFTIKADALEFVKDDSLSEVGIEIHSGQNRVVRRIFESLGYKIIKLDRVYFAGLTKKSVPRGKYRFLSEKEVAFLKMGSHE